MLRIVKHTSSIRAELPVGTAVPEQRLPNGLVFLTDRRMPGDKVGFCQALHPDFLRRFSEKSMEECIQYWYEYCY